ncbi:MAG: DUF2155 domain-containing protein [Nitrospirae bacterium]|nr:DUF2155 domain-containing protein [Nitrospirota bacterium]
MRKFVNMSIIAAAVAGLLSCSDKPGPAPEVSLNPDVLAQKKKDEVRVEKSAAKPDDHKHNGGEGSAPHSAPSEGHGGGEKHQIEIVVPDNVKGKWESVKLSIVDKKTNKTQAVNVKLGSEYKIPDSSITIKAGAFLPDFRMDSLTITSVSAELNNPAVNVTITESGKELFKGWLYSKYPDVHPFEHDRYAITLAEAIRKK